MTVQENQDRAIISLMPQPMAAHTPPHPHLVIPGVTDPDWPYTQHRLLRFLPGNYGQTSFRSLFPLLSYGEMDLPCKVKTEGREQWLAPSTAWGHPSSLPDQLGAFSNYFLCKN